MSTASSNVEMAGFDNDGGIDEFFNQFGISEDYKADLPAHLTEVIRKQAPDAVITRIELLGEPRCNLGGMSDPEDPSLVSVQEVSVPLALRVDLSTGQYKYSLDLELVIKAQTIGETRQLTTDMFVKSQTTLE